MGRLASRLSRDTFKTHLQTLLHGVKAFRLNLRHQYKAKRFKGWHIDQDPWAMTVSMTMLPRPLAQ